MAIILYNVNVGCITANWRPGPSVTLSEAWINSFEPLPTRIPSSGHPVNLESVLSIAAGTNSGYRPQGRRRTRSATSRLRSAGNSYGFSFWSSLTSASKCLRVYAVRPRTSGFMTPDSDRSRMSSQSFSDRKLLDHFSKTLDRAARVPNDARAFQKIRHAERRKKPRGPVRRQHVARSCKVIADHGRRVSPDENGAGVLDIVGNVLRFGHEHFNVLRRDVVHQIDCRVFAGHNECDSFINDGNTSNSAAVKHLKLRPHFIEYRSGHFSGPADEPCAGHLIVFGLSQQIGGDPRRIARLVGNDGHFARPCNHVDIDSAVNLTLCRLHVRIARPDNL